MIFLKFPFEGEGKGNFCWKFTSKCQFIIAEIRMSQCHIQLFTHDFSLFAAGIIWSNTTGVVM